MRGFFNKEYIPKLNKVIQKAETDYARDMSTCFSSSTDHQLESCQQHVGRVYRERVGAVSRMAQFIQEEL